MILAEIKRMQPRDKDQTWKTDKHNNKQKVTKIIHTKKRKQMSNSDSTTNWEHGPGVPAG